MFIVVETYAILFLMISVEFSFFNLAHLVLMLPEYYIHAGAFSLVIFLQNEIQKPILIVYCDFMIITSRSIFRNNLRALKRSHYLLLLIHLDGLKVFPIIILASFFHDDCQYDDLCLFSLSLLKALATISWLKC